MSRVESQMEKIKGTSSKLDDAMKEYENIYKPRGTNEIDALETMTKNRAGNEFITAYVDDIYKNAGEKLASLKLFDLFEDETLPKDTRKLKQDSIKNLLGVIKKNCTSKFNESIDVNISLNLKQKKGETNIRTVLNLPAGSDKKVKVAILCEEEKLEEAKKSAADVIGSDDLINNISAGKINFEKLVSTPKMMIKLGKLGKILGPKGLMPNPKLGTVTNEIIKSVKDIKSGQLEIKNDKDGNIALSIGNKSVSDENLIKNFNAVLDVISKEKPSGVKGNFVKSAFVTSTMGISYKLKLNKSI